MDDKDPNGDAPSPNNPGGPPVVPAHIIPAELPHPTTLGGMLARGVKYAHHFEIDLISDGQRLWAAASAEGRAVLAAIAGEKQAEEQEIEAHRERSRVAAATAAAEAQKVRPPVADPVIDDGAKPNAGTISGAGAGASSTGEASKTA